MEKLAWVESKSGEDETWHAINAVVGARKEQRPFYTAGNPDENSLVPPTSLQYIWPGLKPAGQSDVQVQTLDTAIESAGIPIPQDNTWLLIDCFCAADIVQGTAGLLPACSLVCARVLNNDSNPEEELLHTSTLEAMASLLEPLGFRFVHLHPGLNPAAGHAFFVRDWHAQQRERAETLGQEKASLEKKIEALQNAQAGLEQQVTAGKKEVDAKVAAEQELRQQLAEQQKQVQQLSEQKNAVQQQLTEKETQHTDTANQLKQKNDAVAALTKERDELKQQVGAARQEHKQAREQAATLQQEKDQVSQQHAQQRERAETLGQEKASLEKKIEALQDAKAGLEQQVTAGKKEVDAKVAAEQELRQQLAEQQKQVQQLTEQKNAVQQQLTEKETQHTDTANQLKQKNDAVAALTKERDELKQKTADADHHQQLLQEELTRAEAQIDLIKDLLLREQGLGE
jgi:hypothetical protein